MGPLSFFLVKARICQLAGSSVGTYQTKTVHFALKAVEFIHHMRKLLHLVGS